MGLKEQKTHEQSGLVAGMEVTLGLDNMHLPLSRLILPVLLLRAHLPIAETNIETPMWNHSLQGPASYLMAGGLHWTSSPWAGHTEPPMLAYTAGARTQPPEPRGEVPFLLQCPSRAL